jgi:FtsH-binding integral membrane protein
MNHSNIWIGVVIAVLGTIEVVIAWFLVLDVYLVVGIVVVVVYWGLVVIVLSSVVPVLVVGVVGQALVVWVVMPHICIVFGLSASDDLSHSPMSAYSQDNGQDKHRYADYQHHRD